MYIRYLPKPMITMVEKLPTLEENYKNGRSSFNLGAVDKWNTMDPFDSLGWYHKVWELFSHNISSVF